MYDFVSFLIQVLYNILDWPTKPHSKLIVIGACTICYQHFLPSVLVIICEDKMGTSLTNRYCKYYGSSGEVASEDFKSYGHSKTLLWSL